MKWLFTALLLLCMGFFAVIQWGGTPGRDTPGRDAPLPQPPYNADRIKLLSPSPASAPISPPTFAPVSAPVSAPASLPAIAPTSAPESGGHPQTHSAQQSASPSPVCMEWGEFATEESVPVAADLAALKLGKALSRRSLPHLMGYWAYLPPLKTQAEVNTKVAQLRALGDKNYFIIHDEENLHNAISLGVFKTQEAALNRQRVLTNQGVADVKTGERIMDKRPHTVFVLKKLNAAQIEKMTKLQLDYPDSQLKTVSCGK